MDDGGGRRGDESRPPGIVIVRVWHARAEPNRVAEYVAHFQRLVQPMLESLDGFVGATVLESASPDAAEETREIIVETRWKTMDDIRAFAGPDLSIAVVEPAAAATLVDYDRFVRHYSVIASS